MFMQGTENRKTAITITLQALKNAGVEAPQIDITPNIPKVTRPTAVDFLKAMQKAEAAGTNYAEDKAVQALVTRQALSQVNLYQADEDARVNEQIQVLLDARDDLHNDIETKFDAAAATLVKHTETLTDNPLLDQAKDAMRRGHGGPASEAYAAQLVMKTAAEAWRALHGMLNGTSLSGNQGILAISVPTVRQLDSVNRDRWDVWELAHAGVKFSLAADLHEVRERQQNLDGSRNAERVRGSNHGAMSRADSAAMASAFNTHAESAANKVEEDR
jgi:hypothetical protein